MARSHLLLTPVLALGLALFSTAPLPGSPGIPTAAAGENGVVPGQTEFEKARVVADLLQRYHYGGPESDEKLMEQATETYLKQLDHGRFFLLEEDVEAFRERMGELGPGQGDAILEAAYDLHARYRERVAEQTQFALGLLEEGFDFDGDGRFEQDRSEADWAADRDALDDLWRQRVTHDALTLELAERSTEEIRENLERRYNTLRDRAVDADNEDIMDQFLSAWAGAYDPHSTFLSPQRSEEFDMQMSLQLEGIGAKLTMDQDFTEIVELIPGGPAEQSGELREGERIIGVADGDDGEMKDVVGWRLDEIVDMIRGPKESVVRLNVLPPAGASESSPREVRLVRNKVDLEDQAARKEVIEKTDAQGEEQRVGVITIPKFYRDFEAAHSGQDDFRSTTRDVQRLLGELLEEGIDGLLIDLRGNSGGALREATALTAMFTGGGPAVQVRDARGHPEQVGESRGEPAYDGPLGVLVDRRSASASEIFAAAIKDYGRGIVLGDQTFGKGTVQQMIGLDNYAIPGEERSGQLKLTLAQFYRVTGESTQLEGVKPDIHLPSEFSHEEFGERATRNPLPATEIAGLDVTVHIELETIIDELARRHQTRMDQTETFRALERELEAKREIREDTSVALNKATRQEEQKVREERLLELHNERRKAHGKEPVERYADVDADELPDALLNASAAIIADFAQLLREAGDEVLTAEAREED
ncbi:MULTISPECIES: carboxy terminal-processing peptidase [Halorhodospira]|uniref:carboxy terminal-processing peptidase n=1 Tax=Halorhodospira TaxID=85108 RepID=UPI0019118B0A|nr:MULTISPECIES: carboxy terminal-processing peptidase [Halorhodospira]MBK5942451.1 peptidase S41 [Halorhodospira halophila]MCG5528232.1 carboxy terminal-processing peptidase [Halorhodospira halophila]MCG5543889.1 carboxy terminal-processing peptidase [Halorhodospira sp. 9628]